MKKMMEIIRGCEWGKWLVMGMMFPSLGMWSPALQANPSGGVVVGGAAEIGEGLNGFLQINQMSGRAVINWADFSIAAGELTQFVQPGADSAVLNRVASGNPTAILGALQANGKVAIINTAGILVGPSGTIDVNGLLMSTLDVSNGDFMGGGDMLFSGTTAAGVVNMGRITALGGDVILLGRTVANSGTIDAANGTVALAAGEEVLITAAANVNANGGRVFVRPKGAASGSGTGVDNSGTIRAAAVELKAHGNMYALAINNTGVIRATGISKRGGKVVLSAMGGRIGNSGTISARQADGTGGTIVLDAGVGGSVEAGGNIDASADGKGKIGGVVMISGESVTIPSGAAIKANGEGGGGFVQVGSGEGVDALNVAVQAGSSISANGGSGSGGMVVISGGSDSNVMVAGAVSATSESGDGGIIIVEGGDVTVTQTSTLDASGINGGVITVTGENSAVVNGMLRAVGSSGDGGVINISGGNTTTVGASANIDAGGSVNGGVVTISGGGTTSIEGTINSVGAAGAGGQVQGLGEAVNLMAASRIDVSGFAAGGQVNIGGGFRGKDPQIFNATNTTVESGARIVADAIGDGDGGRVVVWGNGNTLYEGEISARGATSFAKTSAVKVGQGGFTEISGLENLVFLGEVDTGGGDLLLDPFNYVIGVPEAAAIVAALVGSSVTIDTTADVAGFGSSGNNTDAGDITVNSAIFYDSTNDLTFLAMGDAIFNASVQNSNDTGGDINIVAGWDGTTAFNATTFAAKDVTTTTVFGQNNGSVIIGNGGQIAGVAVGSRSGNTRVFGYDVSLQGGTGMGADGRYAQLGFQVSDQGAAYVVDGGIIVHVVNDVTVRGGDTSEYNYVQLGHVGADQSGDATIEAAASGVVELSVGNDISFLAGAGDFAYAQLGHGGSSAKGSRSGTTTITHANDINFQGGMGFRSYAQLGQGGAFAIGSYSGNTTITQANDISFEGGGGESSYAQLGHGGAFSKGSHSGNTTITQANDISFAGGSALFSYAQLGQGGAGASGGAHSGITIITQANDVSFASGGGRASYAQLGQGGRGAIGDHSGNTIIAQANDVSFTANSGGSDAYAQFGQGGYAADGDHSGNISLTQTGNLILSGSNANDRYVLIGNGDELYGGDSDLGETVSGDVMIRTTGNATLTNNAFIGHYIDADGTYASGNTFIGVTGDLTADAAGRFNSAPNGSGGELRIYLGGSDNVDSATLFNGDAHGATSFPNNQGSFVFGSGPYSLPGSQNPTAGNFNYYSIESDIYNYEVDTFSEVNAIQTALEGGSDVALAYNLNQANFGAVYDWDGGTQFIQFDEALLYDANQSLNLFTTGDAIFNASVQNSNDTGGDINIVAGWDGMTAFDASIFEAADITNTTLFGQNNGSTIIGGNQTSGVAVGSRSGTTRAFGYDLKIQGRSNLAVSKGLFGQLGFKATNGKGLSGASAPTITGDILAHFTHNIDIKGGTGNSSSQEFRYAQIGHIGADTFSDNNWTDSAADAAINVMAGRDINLKSGEWNHAYSQIGHGGSRTTANLDGETNVSAVRRLNMLAGRSNANGYVQIGHGGNQSDGNKGGGSGTAINVSASRVILNVSNLASPDAYVMIGAGGLRADSDASGANSTAVNGNGDITVTATGGDVILTSGGNNQTFTQIGHGGVFTKGTNDGNITVSATGAFQLNSGSGGVDGYAQVGHGGGWRSIGAKGSSAGNIIVTAGSVALVAGAGNRAYSQIGSGGFDTEGSIDGAISVTAINAISLKNGEGNGTYAMIGMGGYDADGLKGSISGTAVTVSGSSVTLDATAGGTNSFVQIGAGGYKSDSLISGVSDTERNGLGDISVTATSGDIQLTGSSSGAQIYAQIGHGGRNSKGLTDGAITVTAAGEVGLDAGRSSGAYAQIGHGGKGQNGSRGSLGASSVSVQGARVSLDSTFASGGGYTQIGFGGWGNRVELPQVITGLGNVTVTATNGDIELIGATNTAGDAGGGYAQIGHGGWATVDFTGSMSGDITLNATNGALNLTGGSANQSNVANAGGTFALVGHGGNFRSGDKSGDITVQTDAGVNLQAGASQLGFAQIGHGGSSDGRASGAISGAVSVTVNDGNIDLTGGSNFGSSFAHIGNGGWGMTTDLNGNVSVTATNGAINLTGGSGLNGSANFAMIGNGGADLDGAVDGSTTVTALGDITIAGGAGSEAFAQIGLGGLNVSGAKGAIATSDITVIGDNIILDASGSGASSFIQIGIGGMGSDGSASGEINVTADKNVTLTGQNTTNRYALIGNGDDPGDGDAGDTVEGDVTIRTVQNISLSNALIGSQIDSNGSYTSGNTFLGVGGDLVADVNSRFDSATSGELRVYLFDPSNDQVNAGTLFNGVAHGVVQSPNNQGSFELGQGPYVPTFGNFAYYDLVYNGPWNYIINAGEATNIVNALNGGVDVDLSVMLGQANFGAIIDWNGSPSFVRINADIFYDSTNTLNLLATGDVDFNASVQNSNATGGDINIVAGWDGTTAFDAAVFLAEDVDTTTIYGQNAGSVSIGDGTQAAGIAVGSRSGASNVFGYDVALQAGNGVGAGRFAQIGFQVSDGIALDGTNLGAAPVVNGAIGVHALHDISTTGGDTSSFAYAQIGHVGADQAFDSTVEAAVDAVVEIAAGNDLIFTAGNGAFAYAQLGHGGTFANGNHSGAITVSQANDLIFTSSDGARGYAQLGNGGDEADGNHSGAITLGQINDISFTGGAGFSDYAQLGNGGSGAGGSHSGAITLNQANDISFLGGDGSNAYAQLGHGGSGTDGNHGGPIILSQANNISFTGGVGVIAYAQLGHGGFNSDGNHSGAIDVTASGSLTLVGQDVANRYALIGNGDEPGEGDAGNTVMGDVTVRVGGNATITNGWVGQLLDADGASNTGAMLLQSGGNILINSVIGNGGYDTTSAYSYIAGGDVIFNASVQNRNDTSGDVNIVAGWDGTTAYDTATFAAEDVNSTTVFGAGNGRIYIGNGGQAIGVAVGSRSGTTNVFGYDVSLQAGNGAGVNGRFAQLGFQVTDGIAQDGTNLGAAPAVNGGITVHVTNDVTATAGDTSDYSYAQIGHVGADQSTDSTIEAAANAIIELSVGNDIRFQSGAANFAYAQLGQGGYDTDGNHSGNTTITQANDISFSGGGGFGSYAQLGQGGFNAEGNHSGITTITQANDISFSGEDGFGSYAQLGQGGGFATGNHGGTTTITQANDITFQGGIGDASYAQLGQGGFDADGDHSGNTTIAQANDITFQGGDGIIAYAQLGQGGVDADGSHSGDINVTHLGDLTLTGEDSVNRYAMIGHGDDAGDSDTGNSVMGDVTIRTVGNTTLSNAFIGHLIDTNGTYTSGNTFIGVVGDLTADATSQFNSAPNGSGGELRIYLGGSDNVDSATLFNGDAHGATDFPNNQGSFVFGSGPYSLPGPQNPTAGNFNFYSIESDIYNYEVDTFLEVSAIQVALEGGSDVTLAYNLNQANFGAVYDWDGGTQFIQFDEALFYDANQSLNLFATGDAIFNASVQNSNATGGDINIVTGWDGTTAFDAAVFTAEDVTSTTVFGQNNGTVIIGNGGQNAGVAVGSRSGETSVFGYDVSLQGGQGAGADGRFAQLGFQVSDGIAQDGTNLGATPVVNGGILVHVTNDVTAMGGDTSQYNYAQIGHVGADQSGDLIIEATATAVIELSVGNDISFSGGGGFDAYAQLGQGGIGAYGNHSGTTTITQANDITFLGGFGASRSYAQLGQGGFLAVGDHSGTTTIMQANDVIFTAGDSSATYAQLGQGGVGADGDHNGTITITQVNDVIFTAGFSYVQLGQGGADADGSHSGTTTITRANDISFLAMDGFGAYAQLGQGGYGADGNHSGNTTITQSNDINFLAGNGIGAYAQLGQGGVDADGNHSGNTTITQANDINFSGGNGTATYAQLGQGGFDSNGDHSGNTTIAQANDINFLGGAGSRSYAQLGQGGVFADGNHSGNINVTHTGDLTVSGVNTAKKYALIGHGDDPGDSDAGNSVMGDVTIRTGGNATITNGWVGHLLDADGTFNAGAMQLESGGDIWINSVIGNGGYDTTSAYSYIAGGDVIFNASVQNRNATGGDVNIVAGWEGTTAYDTAAFVSEDVIVTTVFGQNNGSVIIGNGGQVAGVAVGSRSGETSVFGYDVSLQGGQGAGADGRFAQLGFQVSDGIAQDGTNLGAAPVVNGAITVHATNDVTATGGDTSTFNYVQIGHVGADQSGDATIEATATAVIELSVGNDIVFQGGIDFSYAQLGQGGIDADGNHSGTTTITQASDLIFRGGGGNDSYAQLGQGGKSADGNHSGNTTITRANDIIFQGGGRFGYVQLGQGGFDANGDHSGTTTITQANDIIFQGGSDFGYAQLGQGGFEADGNHSGNIDITHTGNLILSGVDTLSRYALIGHGDDLGDSDVGNSVMGDVSIRTVGNTTLSNAFIGHLIDADGSYTSGNTFIGVTGDLTADAASQFNSAPNGNGGELRIYLGGSDNVDSATLFNGDAHGATTFPNNQGDFAFGSGPYSLPGSQNSTAGNFNYYSIESGIYNYEVDTLLEVNAIQAALEGGSDVTLTYNLNQANFGAVYDWDGGTQFIQFDEALFYDANQDLNLFATGDAIFNASVQNSNATGGDINIVSGWDGSTAFDTADFAAEDVTSTTVFGQNGGSVIIGNGGQVAGVAVGSRSGNTSVFGYDVSLQGGNGVGADERFAQLGFQVSNQGAAYVVDGGITVHAVNDVTALGGGTTTFNYAQIGHVGADVNNDSAIEAAANAIIELSVGNDIIFMGGSGFRAYAQLGQGGISARGDHRGNTTITQVNDITFQGGSNEVAYAQLGQGGLGADGNHSGNTTITQANDITFQGGSNNVAYAQLGQGGIGADGDHSGNTTITEANDITFQGGVDQNTYAQLGQGGIFALGNHSGITTITRANDITFRGGNRNLAYAQLGQGGVLATGDHSGNTTIAQANDITFQGGVGSRAYAQLGQGGAGADGNHSGSISLTHTGDLTLTGQNVTNRYALIGHGDDPGDGDAGNTVLGDVTIQTGGNTNLSKAFIGHRIDPDGSYASGNTFIGVGGDFSADAKSAFNSAPAGVGELRLYVAGDDNVDAAAMFNGVPHGATAFPNNQGAYLFGIGPYAPAIGNFAYYNLLLSPIDVMVPPVAPDVPESPTADYPIFVTIDGQLNFNRGVFALDSPYVPVGPFAQEFTDDYFNWDKQRFELDFFDAGDKRGWRGLGGRWTSSFKVIFSEVKGEEGWSGFDLFGEEEENHE